ncbi:MAG: T9SS type A sorting domain-containing protein [Ignavibacteriales bacterium]|nr:T9SS type A sorting domain-containing protein [Ignavibacteriales bacterium]
MNIEGKFIISWPEWEGNHVKKFFIQRFDKYRNKIGEKFKVGTNDTINISNITLNLNNNSIYIVYNKFFDNVNNGIYSQIIDFNNPPSHIDIKNKSNIPKDFILFQNYPNPFNPTTTISYQLPVFSNIVIKVYDILGQEITTLVNENKNPGKYSVEFNAIYLSSGVYFVVLTTNEKRAVIKTLLLK